MEKDTAVTIAVSIPQSMRKWLDEHSNINRSKIFQDAVYTMMHPKAISTQLTMLCILGFISGIALTLVFSTAFIQLYLGTLFSLALMLLGLALSASSFIVYMKARKSTTMVK